jgi:hypothetical protein
MIQLVERKMKQIREEQSHSQPEAYEVDALENSAGCSK